MISEPDEKKIGKIYREILTEGMDPKKLRAEKKAFIELYFAPPPPSFFRPFSWASAAAVGAVSVLLLGILPNGFLREISLNQSTIQKTAGEIEGEISDGEEIVFSPNPETQFRAREKIVISHVSSEVGPTVVYQKNVDQVPVAVVWVVPNAGKS